MDQQSTARLAEVDAWWRGEAYGNKSASTVDESELPFVPLGSSHVHSLPILRVGVQESLVDDLGKNHKPDIVAGGGLFSSQDLVDAAMLDRPAPTTTAAFASVFQNSEYANAGGTSAAAAAATASSAGISGGGAASGVKKTGGGGKKKKTAAVAASIRPPPLGSSNPFMAMAASNAAKKDQSQSSLMTSSSSSSSVKPPQLTSSSSSFNRPIQAPSSSAASTVALSVMDAQSIVPPELLLGGGGLFFPSVRSSIAPEACLLAGDDADDDGNKYIHKTYLDAGMSFSIHPDELVIPRGDSAFKEWKGMLCPPPSSVGPEEETCTCYSGNHCWSYYLRIQTASSSTPPEQVAEPRSKVHNLTEAFHCNPPPDWGFVRSNLFRPISAPISSHGLDTGPQATGHGSASAVMEALEDPFSVCFYPSPSPSSSSPPSSCSSSLIFCRNGHVYCFLCLLVEWIKQSQAQAHELGQDHDHHAFSSSQFRNLYCPTCNAIFSVNKFWRMIYEPSCVASLFEVSNYLSFFREGHHKDVGVGHSSSSSVPQTTASSNEGGPPLGDKTASSTVSEIAAMWDAMAIDGGNTGGSSSSTLVDSSRTAITSTTALDQATMSAAVAVASASYEADIFKYYEFTGHALREDVIAWFLWQWIPIIYYSKREWKRFISQPDNLVLCLDGYPSTFSLQHAAAAATTTTAAATASEYNGGSDNSYANLKPYRIPFVQSRSIELVSKVALHVARKTNSSPNDLTSSTRSKLDQLFHDLARDSVEEIGDWIASGMRSIATHWKRRRLTSRQHQQQQQDAQLVPAEWLIDNPTKFIGLTGAAVARTMPGANQTPILNVLEVKDPVWSFMTSGCLRLLECAMVPLVHSLLPLNSPVAELVKTSPRIDQIFHFIYKVVSVYMGIFTFKSSSCCPCCGFNGSGIDKRQYRFDELRQCLSCKVYFSEQSKTRTSTVYFGATPQDEYTNEYYAKLCSALNDHADSMALRFLSYPPLHDDDNVEEAGGKDEDASTRRTLACASMAAEIKEHLVSTVTSLGRMRRRSPSADTTVLTTLEEWQTSVIGECLALAWDTLLPPVP